MSPRTLTVEPLTAEAFAEFGDVIEVGGGDHYGINGGAVERYHDLARIDIDGAGDGRPAISLARCNRITGRPFRITLVERHPLGSQAFIPLSATPLPVVVAPAGRFDPARLRAFVSNGRQGINYLRGTWHVPLMCQEPGQQFLIVDRAGSGDNCEELPLAEEIRVEF